MVEKDSLVSIWLNKYEEMASKWITHRTAFKKVILLFYSISQYCDHSILSSVFNFLFDTKRPNSDESSFDPDLFLDGE